MKSVIIGIALIVGAMLLTGVSGGLCFLAGVAFLLWWCLE